MFRRIVLAVILSAWPPSYALAQRAEPTATPSSVVRSTLTPGTRVRLATRGSIVEGKVRDADSITVTLENLESRQRTSVALASIDSMWRGTRGTAAGAARGVLIGAVLGSVMARNGGGESCSADASHGITWTCTGPISPRAAMRGAAWGALLGTLMGVQTINWARVTGRPKCRSCKRAAK